MNIKYVMLLVAGMVLTFPLANRKKRVQTLLLQQFPTVILFKRPTGRSWKVMKSSTMPPASWQVCL